MVEGNEEADGVEEGTGLTVGLAAGTGLLFVNELQTH
jgi:hypothetical protein